MEKLDPNKDGISLDVVAGNLNRMRELFPEVFTEGRVDFDALRETLGEHVENGRERYSLTWNGKTQARRVALTPSTGTLRPCPKESLNWGATKNLFIEGDNLEVLKLMQKSYHKKVKMIYIDPPYNTGKEFIYPDNFQDSIDAYLRHTGQVDEKGLRLSTNSESSGRYHTNWLNMMLPRLTLARNLLSEEGVIFISIDDSEIANLRRLCDEVFGEENHCGTIKRRAARKTAFLSGTMSDVCDYVVIYSRGPLSEVLSVESVSDGTRPVFNAGNAITTRNVRAGTEAKCDDGTYPAGKYAARSLSFELLNDMVITNGKVMSEVEVRGPWRINQDVLDKTLYVTRNISLRRRITPEELGKAKAMSDLLDCAQCYNEKGTERLTDLFGVKDVFDTPKPLGLLQYLLRAGNLREGDIVLDFFAGSGTVLDAIWQEGLAVRCFMIQLPEILSPAGAQKVGHDFCVANKMEPRITELGKYRLKRAAEIAGSMEGDNLDFGFKVFKLDSSNIKPWDTDFDALDQTLTDAMENVKAGRSDDDILYELLLKYGIDLALPVESRIIKGKKVCIVGGGALIVCLAAAVALDVIEGIAALKEELKPEVMRVVFRDAGFADDVVKTNAIQILKQASVDDVKSL